MLRMDASVGKPGAQRKGNGPTVFADIAIAGGASTAATDTAMAAA